MVRALGKRAKDQLVTLIVAVRVPSEVSWTDTPDLPAHDREALRDGGCGALPARLVAQSLVAALCDTLVQLGGVRYALANRSVWHPHGTPRPATSRAEATPYAEVYDATWLPVKVSAKAVSAAAAAEVSATSDAPRRKRARKEDESTAVVAPFAPLCGATRATEDVLRWTRQLRVRLMWRPPGGRGMPSQNLLRAACATLQHVPLSLSAGDLVDASAEAPRAVASRAGGYRRGRCDALLLDLHVAVRVHCA